MTRSRMIPASRMRCAALLCLLLAAGCDNLISDFDRDPDAVPREEIISLTRAGTGTLAANGTTRETFFARIPNNASAASRVITFTTTAGFFELNNAKEVKVRAERDASQPKGPLVAIAVLRADTLTTTAVVSATVSDYRDTVWVPMVR
jgi:hypothetical protein